MSKITLQSFGLLLIPILLLVTGCSDKKDMDADTDSGYFNNPILEDGPDPYVYLHKDGYYYCMVTRGNRLKLWKSVSFTDIVDSEGKDIF